MTYNAVYILYVIGQHLDFRRLALRLEVLSSQVQRLSRERDATQLNGDRVSLLLKRYQKHSLCIYTEFISVTDVQLLFTYLFTPYGCIWILFSVLDRTSEDWFSW